MHHARKHPTRRAVLAGAFATAGALVLAGCASVPPLSFEEAVRRLLVLSSERAFVRLTEPGGYWDRQVAELGLQRVLGTRGDALARVLTSGLFKSRLESVVADAAVDASYRAAPVVTDAVRAIGISNALALVRGESGAATAYLRQQLGGRLLTTLVPEVGEALLIAEDPLLRELIAGATGIDPGTVAPALAAAIEERIWTEISREEAAIRADPAATRDPVIRGVFGAGAAI